MSKERCRICLGFLSCSSSQVDIFTEKNMHLIRQLYSITGVQLTNIDGHPRHMCNNCLINLENAIKFRQRCILSQKQFLVEKHSEKVKREPMNVENYDNLNKNLEDDDSSDQDIIEEIAEETYEQADLENIEEDSDSQIEYYFTATEAVADNNVEQINNEFEKKRLKNQAQIGQYICDECGKSLSTKGSFQEHKRRHAGIKDFICRICHKSFTTHTELIRHTRQHTGERPYACRYCSSRFGDLSTHRQHERRHTNTRPYTCGVCGKSFISSSCLCKHRLIHQLVPRTHHCTICDLWFQRPDHLTAHLSSRNHKLKVQARNMMNLIR